MHLDAEVSVIESSEEVPIAGIVHYERDIVPYKCGTADGPLRHAPIHRKQTLPRCDVTPIAHSFPPDSACMTSIVDFDCTGSLRRSRSRTSSPSMKTTMCCRILPCSSSTYPRALSFSRKYPSSTSRSVAPEISRDGQST